MKEEVKKTDIIFFVLVMVSIVLYGVIVHKGENIKIDNKIEHIEKDNK